MFLFSEGVAECLDFTFGDAYLLQKSANLSASSFISWRVHEVDRCFLFFREFWCISGRLGDFAVILPQNKTPVWGPKWKSVNTELQTLNSHFSVGEKKKISLMVAECRPINNINSGPAPLEHSYMSAMIICFPFFFWCVWVAENQTFPTTNCIC